MKRLIKQRIWRILICVVIHCAVTHHGFSQIDNTSTGSTGYELAEKHLPAIRAVIACRYQSRCPIDGTYKRFSNEKLGLLAESLLKEIKTTGADRYKDLDEYYTKRAQHPSGPNRLSDDRRDFDETTTPPMKGLYPLSYSMFIVPKTNMRRGIISNATKNWNNIDSQINPPLKEGQKFEEDAAVDFNKVRSHSGILLRKNNQMFFLTAGHAGKSPKDYFIRSYNTKSKRTLQGNQNLRFAARKRFWLRGKGKKAVCQSYGNAHTPDFAIWKVRKLGMLPKVYEPLTINEDNWRKEYEVPKGTNLVAYGYPRGMSLKESFNGKPKGKPGENWGDEYLFTDLDVNQGYSGAPVFSIDKNEDNPILEGIVIGSGGVVKDFILTDDFENTKWACGAGDYHFQTRVLKIRAIADFLKAESKRDPQNKDLKMASELFEVPEEASALASQRKKSLPTPDHSINLVYERVYVQGDFLVREPRNGNPKVLIPLLTTTVTLMSKNMVYVYERKTLVELLKTPEEQSKVRKDVIPIDLIKTPESKNEEVPQWLEFMPKWKVWDPNPYSPVLQPALGGIGASDVIDVLPDFANELQLTWLCEDEFIELQYLENPTPSISIGYVQGGVFRNTRFKASEKE